MAEEPVTRRDLEAVRTELKADIQRVEISLADLRTEVAKELGQIHSEVGTVRTEVVGLLGQLGSRLTAAETTSQHTQAAMQELQQEMRDLRGEMRQEMRDLRGEMRDLHRTVGQFSTAVTRQMWTIITVVAGAIVVGLVKLVFFPGGTP